MLHKQLLSKHKGSTLRTQKEPSAQKSKHKGSTLRTQKELSAQKKFQNTHDCMSTHENNLNKQYIRGMDPSTGMGSNLVRKEAANSSVNKQNIKASEPTIYPLNPGCELVKNVAYPPKDDIFGDLPLLESSKVMFHSGVDELPTVIEDSFVTDQSGPEAISENVSLKLIPPSDMSVQTSSTLKDLVKKEGTPAKKSICISRNDVKKNLPSSAEFDGLNHNGINMVKTCLSDTQLKSTDVPALSSYSNKGLKSGSSNTAHTQQDCFSMNTNYCQEIRKPGTSIATSSVTVRTRTEAIARRAPESLVHWFQRSAIFHLKAVFCPQQYHKVLPVQQPVRMACLPTRVYLPRTVFPLPVSMVPLHVICSVKVGNLLIHAHHYQRRTSVVGTQNFTQFALQQALVQVL